MKLKRRATQSDAERRRATLKVHYALIFILIFGAILFGCTTEQTNSQSVQQIDNGGNKISSLQAVIDSDEVKDGDEIDLSQYKDITDFNYNATINKSITIKNGNDLKGASLNVVTDGVTLSGINKASVTTQSSLKISGSSLSSLNIAAVSSSGSLSSVEVNGRGDNDRTSMGLSARSSLSDRINPPTVEITDNSSVTNTVTVAIENAQITAEKLTAGEINLAGMNTQLTIKDKDTSINKITTDKVCQVVLEKGVGTNIPNSTDKIEVSDNGELTQIDMTAISSKRLTALTLMSGLKTVVKKGGSIDFSDVVMLGTYFTEGSGIKVFRALSEAEFTDTFSKLEKNFVIEFGDKRDVIFKDGMPTNFAWTANVGTFNAYIVSEYEPQVENCEYQFEITVLDVDGDNDELPTFELKSITAQKGTAKTDYTVGDLLDLRGIIVLGEYEASPTMKYNGIVTDYTLNPSNGTPLTTVGKQNVTITAEGQTAAIEITVNEAKPQVKRYTVKFNANGGEGTMANQDMTCDLSADLTANTFTRTGYTFIGWAETADGEVKYADGAAVTNLTTANGTIVPLYAKWTPITYSIRFDSNGGSGLMDNQRFEYDDEKSLSLCAFTAPNYKKFYNWNEKADGTGVSYNDGQTVKNLTDKSETIVLYAQWVDKNAHSIKYNNLQSALNNDNPKTFKENEKVEIKSVSMTGYDFVGWFDASTDGNQVTGWDAGAKTADVELWARWTAHTYKIAFNSNDGTGDMADMDMTYNVSKTLTANAFTRTGYTFVGWATSADGDVEYANEQTVSNLTEVSNETVNLYAKLVPITYTITFNANGGTGSMSGMSMTYDVSKPLTANAFTKIGYSFGGWTTSADGDVEYANEQAVSNLSAFNNGTFTLYAKWNPELADYTVKRYFQKVTGGSEVDDYEQDFDSYQDLTKQGYTDSTTDVTADTVDGFDLQTIVQQKIAGNGSTVVNVYYNRKTITYTFNSAGGNWNGNTENKSVEGLFGASVTKPVDPTKTGYVFAGWDKTVPSIFGADGETFMAQWILGNGTIIEVVTPTYQDVAGLLSYDDGTFTALGGYQSYKWYIDEERQAETSLTLTPDTSSMSGGHHSVSVFVTDSHGNAYSAAMTFRVKK